MQPLRWWAESAPHRGYRVKVSENLGATAVTLVAPEDTSLMCTTIMLYLSQLHVIVSLRALACWCASGTS